MAGYQSLKMKRKELEDVYDDFSDFSLSSPARKIRRLDVDLPPIMEEEEAVIPLEIDPREQQQQQPSSVLMTETELIFPSNEERALVLYKPVNSPLFQSSTASSNVSVTVNPCLIPGFNNGGFWSSYSNFLKSGEEKSKSTDKNAVTNNCLAVVPWVSNQLQSVPGMDASASELSEPMEAEEVDDGSMEIEDVSASGIEGQAGKTVGLEEGESLQPWHQQHCTTAQLLPNTPATSMWSW